MRERRGREIEDKRLKMKELRISLDKLVSRKKNKPKEDRSREFLKIKDVTEEKVAKPTRFKEVL